MHKDLLRELDRFKAEEMARMDRKIEDSRDGMRREMEFLYNRNIQALNVWNQYFFVYHWFDLQGVLIIPIIFLICFHS